MGKQRTIAAGGRIQRVIRSKVSSASRTAELAIERARTTNTRRGRIAYIGAQGFNNLGDDVMYEAACALFAGDAVVSYQEPWHERRLRRLGLGGSPFFETAILGGGTLINPFGVQRVQCALSQGLPVITLGTGVGSCGFRHANKVDISEWKSLLADFRRIGVRGPRSKQALECIGVNRVEVIGDLALWGACEGFRPPTDPPRFAINIAVPDDSVEDERIHSTSEYEQLDELSGVIRKLVSDRWLPVPIPMNDSDIGPIERLLASAGINGVAVNRVQNIEQFRQVVSGCVFTIAVRLHAAVLSCCVGVPPLLIGYRDKCLDFMESMELGEWHVSL